MSRGEAPLKAVLAAAAKRERARLAWTQERAAAEAGLALRHYQRLEEGSANATLETLEKVARAFGVSPLRLLTP